MRKAENRVVGNMSRTEAMGNQMPEGWSLGQLPDEVLVLVFSYLAMEDLCIIAVCCKRLNRISSDNSLWQPFCGTLRNNSRLVSCLINQYIF